MAHCWVLRQQDHGLDLVSPFVGGGFGVWVLFVSGFLAAPSTHVCVCGVCGTGLLFENYIVDASIFYKKQFPRIYEPGSVVPSLSRVG